MTSESRADQIRWDLVPDTSADLFDDLNKARDALAHGKCAKAERLAASLLARLSRVSEKTLREPAIPTSAVRAPAEVVVGIAAQRQDRPDDGTAHLTAATLIFRDLMEAGYELDAASRGEYITALLLTGRAGSALDLTRGTLESGRELSPAVVLQVAATLRQADGAEPAVDLLRLAHRRQPDRVDVTDALAQALEEAGQQDAAAQIRLEAAVLLARQGNYAESEEHFRRSLADAPGSSAAMAGLAQLLLAQGKTEQAIEILQLSVDQGVSTPEITALRAEALAKTGEAGRAIEVARGGLEKFGDHSVLVRTYAGVLIDAGKAEEAAPWLERALAEDPDDLDLLRVKAEMLLGLDDPEGAIGILRPLVLEFPESGRHRATLVRALIAAGHELDASDTLVAGLSATPEDPALLAVRPAVEKSLADYVDQHFDETENPSVRAALERTLALDPTNSSAHAWLGEVLRREGELNEALAHLNLAIDGTPDDGWVVGTRGQVLYALGRPEALDELRRGVELDDSLPWLHAQLGDAYRMAGRYREALDELARATTLAPEDGWAWALTGATQSQLGRWEEARSSLDKAIRLDPGYAWAQVVKANLLDNLDELDDALATVRAALETDPRIGWAWGLRSWLIDLQDGDPVEQEEAALNALRLEPGDIFLTICLAEAQLRLQREEEAESNFEAGVDSAAASSALGTDSLQHLAWCHLRLRNYDKALDCLSALMAQNYSEISAGYDLGLTLLCAGRNDVALDEYEDVARRTRSERHAGRRRNIVRVARHDLQRMLEREQIKRGHEVERVQEILDQALAGDPAREAER
jgi:tetratricopeptide (TPR) repeat protein